MQSFSPQLILGANANMSAPFGTYSGDAHPVRPWDFGRPDSPIADQRQLDYVTMPGRSNIVQNVGGIFIPTLFFANARELQYRIESTPRGTDVIVSARPSSHSLDERIARHASEHVWLTNNRERYPGQWVALQDGQLLASGSDAAAVYKIARSRGASKPYVTYIDLTDERPFGGW